MSWDDGWRKGLEAGRAEGEKAATERIGPLTVRLFDALALRRDHYGSFVSRLLDEAGPIIEDLRGEQSGAGEAQA